MDISPWISDFVDSLIICRKNRDVKLEFCSLRLSTSEDEKDCNIRIGTM